jgi:hypothetical protein
MRDRERFLQVAKTVNPRLYPHSSAVFAQVCEAIEAGHQLTDRPEDDVITLTYHESPHIRSLACEALHYGFGKMRDASGKVLASGGIVKGGGGLGGDTP